MRNSQALRLLPAKLLGGPERLCVGLLHQVLRLGRVAGEVVRKVVERIGVRQRFAHEAARREA